MRWTMAGRPWRIAEEPESDPQPRDLAGWGGAGDTGTMRVLLVEDEVRLADAITRGLAAEGFEVEAVHDGLEGLWRAREHRYAAVILDIMLPGMNGYQICRTLREEDIWTPILMLTAKDGEWDEAEALDTGADDFLSKPFSFVVLVARLRAILRRGAAPRPAVLVVGDLQLDPATREVHRGDDLVDLTGPRVRAARAPHAPPAGGRGQVRPARGRVGPRERCRPQRRRGVRRLPPQEARRSVRPPLDRHRARSGLPGGRGCRDRTVRACGAPHPGGHARHRGGRPRRGGLAGADGRAVDDRGARAGRAGAAGQRAHRHRVGHASPTRSTCRAPGPANGCR